MAEKAVHEDARIRGRLSSGARWSGGARHRPLIMGIVNVTPDSFHDGGRHDTAGTAVAHARRLVDEGADFIDVGGESTRPGAAAVGEAEELDRVIPVIEAVAGMADVGISIDTSRPAVMREAVAAGATLINDVRALDGAPDALETAAALGVAVCIMHMRGQPRTMQADPRYDDVVSEVHAWLAARAEACEAAGIGRDALFVDPGIGFGKLLAHNLALLKAVPELVAAGRPVLIGASRKSMLGEITGQPSERRLYASLAVAVHAARSGAAILRVHDVEATVESLKTWAALEDA